MNQFNTDQKIDLTHLSVGTITAPDGCVHDKIAPCAIIAQTLEGRYEVTLNGQTCSIAPGEAFLAPTDAPLHIVHLAPHRRTVMRARWLHIQFHICSAIDLTAWLDMPLRLTRAQAAPLGKIIEQLLLLPSPSDFPRPITQLAIFHHLAFQALDHLCALCPPRPRAAQHLSAIGRLEPMFAHIRAHMNQPLCVESLAQVLSISTSLLHALCRQLLGCTPMQYVRQTRLSEARRRLIATTDPIADIAADTGFPNPFHFSRTFTYAFGQPPSHYRHDHQLWHPPGHIPSASKS
ncbi:MAG: helix-turn-helix transcriptional regulator [Phycisphaerales bacterium]